MVDAAENAHTVRPFDALRADAREQVKHAMVVREVIDIGVELGNEAKGRAALLAFQFILRDRWGYPGRVTTDFRGCKLGTGHQTVLGFLSEAQMDV